ncbi:MAG TPA: 23S rRNA (pseudouridine(1915)-N(3))-methyltransferase RlmH [Gemmatimonadales bacterium]|nr:23S rRNA (pseudouridine(1915)-N(3))-methyltransferase RlmH [Gemmatimonadales bacterium]HRZ10150.1 23S rRNA (pseudouridine(1915)-N(3))-methyltransferase RlmH [Gemmatimonadales bacterium]
MELWLLAVGKLRPCYREACDDYLRRIGRRAKVHEVEVREAARAPTRAVQQAEEADRLRARIPPRAQVVALAREGRAWTSAELADRFARWEADARPLVFLVGGSTGLDPGLVTESESVWSLGPLTLPHELARVVVVEQIYRAGTILRGEPYHKGR